MKAVTVSTGNHGKRKMCFDPNFTRPLPLDGEVLLEVILAGICGTDLEILEGYKSLTSTPILGHEFVGRIVAFGPDKPEHGTDFRVGDRVVAEINCMPQHIRSTHNASERALHPARTALGIFGRNGAFSEMVTVPIENIHRVPDKVSDIEAVFIEPIAAACQIMEQVNIPLSHKVAVLGAGKLGWLITQVLRSSEKNVTVISRTMDGNKSRIDRNASNQDLATIFKVPLLTLSELGGAEHLSNCFDEVVDCTGNPTGLETAFQIVKPRGTVILKSTTAETNTARAANLNPVVVKELNIIGSRCGPFAKAMALLESQKVLPEILVDAIFPIEQADRAFEKAKERGILKVLLRI